MRGPHTVSDVMTHTAVAVGRDAPFKDVVTLMQEWKVSALPDLAKAGGLNAADVMTAPAVTVHPGATLGEAARIMARRRVKRLPVVNAEGLLEGVVSRADLLKVFLRTDEELAEEVRRDVVEPLVPAFQGQVGVRVSNGVVTLTGRVVNTSVVPLATRMARTVEGVVDVEWDLADETATGET